MDKTKIVKVRNRDTGVVSYSIPDLNLTRSYKPNELKEITVEELLKLHYVGGGDYILKNCLLIEDEAVLREILDGGSVEPEYFYTEKEVKDLLLYGSLDEFLDCLDFAPAGVIALVKDLAVKLEINDIQKRNAIFEKTGLNVNSAIAFNAEVKETEEVKPATRRVSAENKVEDAQPAAPTRRVESKYKVIK
jgi:hypothetical protein